MLQQWGPRFLRGRTIPRFSLATAAAPTLSTQTSNPTTTTSKSTVRTFFSPHPTPPPPSSESEYKSLEYPLAKEPPEITKTLADQVRGQAPKTTKDLRPVHDGATGQLPSNIGGASSDNNNNNNNTTAVTAEWIQNRREQGLSDGVSAIAPTVPAYIPPNFPADALSAPETQVTALANGVRVVSIETYGQVSVVGTVSAVGSQWEMPGTTQHASQLLEALAFGTTRHRTGLDVAHLLQDWGGTRFVNTGREQSLHCIDVLRPNVRQAFGLLAECVLQPAFDPLEVEEAKMALHYQAMDLPPELWLSEAIQTAAFGVHQPLGRGHFFPPPTDVTPEGLPTTPPLPHLTAAVVEEYWHESFSRNPHQLVVAGAGVQHDALLALAEEHFGHLESSTALHAPSAPPPSSKYQGGYCHLPYPSPQDEFVRIGLVWPTGGWHGDDLVATCVLQTLLGGGSSFSAGGPGKGMYSRLYRQVLNRHSWAESAEAITAFFNDSGLWGLTGSCAPKRAADMTQVLADHAHRLAATPVSDEELDRARNMLKNNVLTQLESRLVLFEDLGRQVLTYGKREDMHTTCERIESVTAEDLMRVAQKALQHTPSIAAVGAQLDFVPRHDEVVRWFRG